jgi:hypothetical protein
MKQLAKQRSRDGGELQLREAASFTKVRRGTTGGGRWMMDENGNP